MHCQTRFSCPHFFRWNLERARSSERCWCLLLPTIPRKQSSVYLAALALPFVAVVVVVVVKPDVSTVLSQSCCNFSASYLSPYPDAILPVVFWICLRLISYFILFVPSRSFCRKRSASAIISAASRRCPPVSPSSGICCITQHRAYVFRVRIIIGQVARTTNIADEMAKASFFGTIMQ